MESPSVTAVAPRRIAVLGGAGGIGRALVKRLTAMGDEVLVMDFPLSLERHPPPGRAIGIDVRSETSIMTGFDSLAADGKPLDGFVFLAGHRGDKGLIQDLDLANYDDVLDVNLRGAAITAKAALPLLAKSSSGSLVLTASALAHVIMPGYGPYTISKAGLLALGKMLAVEAAPAVRVNMVAPSAVDTAFLRGGTGRSDETAPVSFDRDSMAKAIPLQRLAEPDDVVGPIVFLLGRDSAYMTGQTLWVTGGSYMA